MLCLYATVLFFHVLTNVSKTLDKCDGVVNINLSTKEKLNDL